MRLVQSCLAACLVLTPFGAEAWDMMGTKRIELRTRDGDIIPVGSVTFEPDGPGSRFKLALDLTDFRDHFLSMREFKCVEGPELQCYVPYPYKNPATVTRADLSWLEHSLIFFFKAPTDYGAKLANGLYYTMRVTDAGIVGTPQSVDLNEIAAPPGNLDVPPLGPESRSDIEPRARWIEGLFIR